MQCDDQQTADWNGRPELKVYCGERGAAAIVLLICVPLIPVSIAAVQTWAKKLLSKYWGQLGSFFHVAMNGMAASDKIFRLLNLPEPKQGVKTVPVDCSIECKCLRFSYEPEREILHGIDLSFPKGMRTVENANKIVVLSRGTVAEMGVPEDLMKKNGVFVRMGKLQTESQNWTLT